LDKPKDDELSALGLAWEDVAADFECAVWPDNEKSVQVFVDMGTQWRMGFNGPYGLDFNVLPMLFHAHRVSRSLWSDMIHDVRVMESAALAAMRENRR
jgi:hypothetical protein